MRYEAVIGFNTKQVWVYDNKNDVYIDPPTEVLKKLPNWRNNPDECIEQMNQLCNEKNPDWLLDKNSWESDIDI